MPGSQSLENLTLNLYSTSEIKLAQTVKVISELIGKILKGGKRGIVLSETPVSEFTPL